MPLKTTYLFYILCVFLCFQTTQSQSVIVLNEYTNRPIADVSIYNQKKTKTVVTDTTGKADISNFNADEILFFQNFLYEDLKLKKTKITQQNNIVYLRPIVEDLTEVVLSASKFKQSKREVPQSIINFSAKDILFSNPQTSADALDQMGNIFIQKSQSGGGSPMIRGFSTNRLLITVDGVRMNNAIFRGGNLQNVISIDPLSIQNTEVTLGAGSVVYGSDAIGGVMSFYTKKPQLSYNNNPLIKGNTLARYATANNEKTAHFDFNLGYKNWAFLSNVSVTDFEDLRMGSHGPNEYLRPFFVEQQNGNDVLVSNPNPKLQNPTGYSQINLMQKILYKPNDRLNFDFGLYYTTTSDYPRYDRLIRPDNEGSGLRSSEWEYGPQQWFMANVQLTKLSSSSNLYDKIRASLAYQNFKESRSDRDFGSNLRENRSENLDAFSFNLDLEKKLSDNTSLFYGIEYLFNKVGSVGAEEDITTSTSVPNVTRYPNGATWQSAAAYTSIKYKPNSKFVFQSGLRYNQVLANADFTENNAFLNLPFSSTKLNTGAFTGTAGITWSPSKIIQWSLNTSTAFRAPNIDDIGKVFDSEPGSVVVPNGDLKPEYAYSGELGLKLNFDDAVILDLATYYTFLDNALIRRNFILDGDTEIVYDGELSTVQAIQNASKAWIYGFEAGLQFNISERLKLNSKYNIIGGTEDNDGIEVPVRHVAPNFGRSHLVWQNDKFKIDAFAVYNNTLRFNKLAPSELSKDYLYSTDADGNPFSPSWLTLNLRTQYTFNTHFSVTTSLENITDQRYRPYSSGIAAPGRNLILALKYSL